MKRKTSIVVCSVCFLLAAVSAYPEKIKIGHIYEKGFFEKQAAGGYAGLGYEYMSEIGMYTGWDYEFIFVPMSDGLQKLRSGEIDFFMPLHRTEERRTQVLFPEKPLCVNRAVLLVREESPVLYEDFQAISGMVVGGITGNRNNECLESYAAEHGFSYTLQLFRNLEEMEAALNAGTIGALLCSLDYRLSHCKVVARLDPLPVYAAAAPGNETLLRQFDAAAEQIASNSPFFINYLDQKYTSAENITPAFTAAETEYLSRKQKVTVLCPADFRPLSYLQDGKTAGIMPDILHKIGQMSGLQFEFVSVPADRAAADGGLYDMLASGDADMLFATVHDYNIADTKNIFFTNAFLPFRTVELRNPGFEYEPGVRHDVCGVLKEDMLLPFFPAQLKKENRQYEEFSTLQESLDALRRGTVSCVYSSHFAADYYLNRAKYRNFSYRTVSSVEQTVSFGVSPQAGAMLVSVLNRCLACISNREMQEIVMNMPPAESSFLDLLYSFFPQTMLLLTGLFLACAVFILTVRIGIAAWKKSVTLQSMLVQAQKADAAKFQFLSNMSHEMRTPLNAIIGLNRILSENKDDPEVVAMTVTKTAAASEHLLQLINDVLDMSKINEGKMTLHEAPFSIRNTVGMMLVVYKSLMDEKHLAVESHIDVHIPTFVIGDELKLKQVLINLVSNAIKYNKPDGSIRITATAVQQKEIDGNDTVFVSFSVSDSGIGIAEADTEKIFRVFERVENSTADRPGTGLGLSIAFNLVQLMGGKLQVRSTVGEGSEFFFTVPFVAVSESESRQCLKEQQLQQEQTGMRYDGSRILVVEDSQVNAEIVRYLLESRDIAVELAGNGKEACDAVEQHPAQYYDMIFMDIRMPVMNGLDAAVYIRSLAEKGRPDCADIPIVALSANAFDDDKKKSAAAGMNAHLAKPIEPDLLFVTVSYFLRGGGVSLPAEISMCR